MRSTTRRLIAAATALLTAVIALVAVLALAGSAFRGIARPEASAVPTPGPDAPASSRPSASPSAGPLEVLAAIEEQVRDLRQLPAADIGPPDVVSREELSGILAEELDAAWTDEQLATDNLELRAMGLLSADQDIKDLTQRLYEAEVLGFYDFASKRMVVVTDAGLDALARITYAHEYTHALQDAAFDTGAAHDATAENDDAALARLSLEEGDATFVMYRWAVMPGNLSLGELAGIGETPLPDVSGFPSWMVQQLEVPYLAGLQLVTALQEQGGWQAVDAAYANPPISTEQVLHPEKYLAGEDPLPVAHVDLAAGLGGGWRQLEATTIGEATTAIWLQYLGASSDAAPAAAAGWGGDRLVLARKGDDWALAWTLAWDSAADADEFAAAYASTSAPDGIVTRLLRISPTETLVLHASSRAVLAREVDVTSPSAR